MAVKLTNEASIEKILSEMTLEEKAEMIQGSSPFRSAAMPKYGIPAIYMIDTCTGMNMREFYGESVYQKLAAEAEAAGKPLDREKNGYMGGLLLAMGGLKKMMEAEASAQKSDPAKKKEKKQENGCYPPGIALGCTWNPEIAEKCGKIVAEELGSKGIDMILGPCINIMRDPLHGRLAETYAEDPKLMGVVAAGTVRGIQSTGVLADLKHFAANNQEKDRMGVEEHIPERALREIYFPAFKECVKAGAKTVMSAYNNVNGVPAAMNSWLQTEVLRKEWGFDGFVVSDWGASYDVPSAVAAGTDLTMPGPLSIAKIVRAVQEGRLKEEQLDRAIRNILHVTLQSNAFTGKRLSFDLVDAFRVAEEAARESIVLLKNDGTLPLEKDAKVVFRGKRSRNFVMAPASVAVTTDFGTNPYDEAVRLAGSEHVSLEKPVEDTKYWIVTVGADACEGADRTTMAMDPDDKEALEQSLQEAEAVGGKVILIVNAVGPVDLSEYVTKVNAILCPFFAGMAGGKVTADILYGEVNPSGRLPLSWPVHYCDTPGYKNYGGENKEVWYGEGIYVGYRWYDARHIRTLFPFGYGLSYTTFKVSDLVIPGNVVVDGANVPVMFKVKNTGTKAGAEVIQLYVHDRTTVYDRPEKELKAFAKVYLEPEEETTITLTLKKEDFAGYYLPYHAWIVQPGMFDILIGTSAENIVLTKEIHIRCRNPFGLSGKTGIGAIAANPEALEIVNRNIEGKLEELEAVAIAYAPDKTLEELWEGTNMQNALKKKGWNEKEIKRCYETIIKEFDELEARNI